jgi:hypothetical protein
MSTELATMFGEDHHEKYAEVLESWASKAAGKNVTDAMVAQWGADLHEALAEDITDALTAKDALARWSSKGITLPSPEVIKMFSQIAAKYTLQYATRDLLDRLVKSATFDKENPSETTITAAIRPMRPSELIKRAPQTLAQVFDMAKDKFNNALTNHMVKTGQFSGRRRWVTTSKNSRHASLNQEVKDFNEFFLFGKEKVVGPRPVGGSPAHWSNCSCRLQYETKKGRWIDG